MALFGGSLLKSIRWVLFPERRRQLSDSIEMVNKSMKWMPSNDLLKETMLYAYKILMRAHTMSSNCEEALSAFENAIKINPDDMDLYNDLTPCLMKIGHREDAEKALRYALQLSPNAANPTCNLGLLHFYERKIDEAESELSTCLKLGTNNWRMYLSYGNILAHRKNQREATRTYRLAYKLDPTNPIIMNELGYSLLILNENLEEAVRLTEGAVKANPSNPNMRDSLGWAYFKTGKYKNAERELLVAAEGNPKSAVILEHLGDLYRKQNRKKNSSFYWQKALSLATEEEMKLRLQSKIDGNYKK
jgi:Flp pilus assembly protein TadD